MIKPQEGPVQQIRKRITYANAMSTIAVVLSLGGTTAYAASHLAKNSVGARQLKTNAVTGAKVRDGSLTGADVNAATLGQVPSAKNADGAAPLGAASGALDGNYPNPTIAPEAVGTAALTDGAVTAAKLAPGSVGKAGLGEGAVRGKSLGISRTVSESFLGHGFVHGPNSTNLLQVQCPSGSKMISGGYDSSPIGAFQPSATFPNGNGWALQGFVAGTIEAGIRVFANCLE
jgi:hypothetical protein